MTSNVLVVQNLVASDLLTPKTLQLLLNGLTSGAGTGGVGAQNSPLSQQSYQAALLAAALQQQQQALNSQAMPLKDAPRAFQVCC